MNKKKIAVYCTYNPVTMMSELILELHKLGVETNYSFSNPNGLYLIETPKVTIQIVNSLRNLDGMRYDELFGFPLEWGAWMRKDPKEKPFKGSLTDYILQTNNKESN